jgi:3-oxoacyl-[acyl-carrier-protein] synthase II
MKAKITGKGLVSPIGDGSKGVFLPATDHTWFKNENPDFTKYFDAKAARRTSKILKMSLVAAFDALGDDQEHIDGIIVGTGLGCIGDSEKFITSMIAYNESTLSPTPFIQSTHNTIAGSIALQLKVHQYNLTYSERIFSFEWTLLDALMQVNETTDSLRFLVGAADELTEKTFNIAKSLKIFQDLDESKVDIKNIKSTSVIAGEHAAFFTLTNDSSDNPSLHFVKMYFQQSNLQVVTGIKKAVKDAGFEKLDCILIGINGHQVYDKNYDAIVEEFKDSNLGCYKNICGENLVASSFAFWLGLEILEKDAMPAEVALKLVNKDFKNILILNHLKNDYLSAIFISK